MSTTPPTPPNPPPGNVGAGSHATEAVVTPRTTGAVGANVHASSHPLPPPHSGQATPPPKPNMFSKTWANRGKITFGLFLAYSSANFF